MITPGTVETAPETVLPLQSEYPFARVDLMPPEIHERRRLARAKGWMALAVVGTLAAAGGVWFTAAQDASEAADALATEQARTAQLQAQAAEYSEVPALLSRLDRAQTALQTAMAPDVEWYRYVAQLGSTAPEGVWFRTVTVTSAAPSASGAVPGGDPLAPVGSVADISVEGSALDYTDVAAWLDGLDGVSNLDYVLFSDATRDATSGEEPYVDFTSSAKVDDDALSNRYTKGGE